MAEPTVCRDENRHPMIPVPDISPGDTIAGNIDHLPQWDAIPEKFRSGYNNDNEPHCEFISRWFYVGLSPADLDRLATRPGVEKTKALRAIRAALGSFDPPHERKIAGLAYLLSEWFVLVPAEPWRN